jgi:hypothetical protein
MTFSLVVVVAATVIAITTIVLTLGATLVVMVTGTAGPGIADTRRPSRDRHKQQEDGQQNQRRA